MAKNTLVTLISIAMAILSNSCQNPNPETENKQKAYTPPTSYEEAYRWADSMVSQMTLEEKVSMIGGQEIFYTTDIPRLNIPRTLFVDATQGIHLRESFDEFTYDLPIDSSTAMPSPILLASTWNKDFAHNYAKAIGEECQAGGIPVLLGPGMNIYRISQCGRNFEYFGEDPFLASRMIENYVVGLQNTGTIATLKHFVANNTDFFRRKSNSILDARTLNEIYLPAFKAGVDAGALAVMTAYNLIDGEWAGQSEYVINDLLRTQLGFKWLVMTDWWSVYDGEKVIKSGQDLEMPDRDATLNALELVKSGKVQEKDIDRMVKSFLTTLKAVNAFDIEKKPELMERLPEHEMVALNTAREGTILLENKNNLLPVSGTVNKILVTGPYADNLAHGGGAATVDGYNNIKLIDALKNEFGDKINFVEEATDDEIANAEIVFLCIGTYDSEGYDRPFDLPSETELLVKNLTKLNEKTVVIINSGSGVNMSAWNKDAGAILYAWYPGQIGNRATAEILSGKVNPSGKLPITIEKDFKDSPGFGYMKGEPFYEGWNSEGENAHAVYDVNYNEGIFVGYRWYEKENIEPLYAFGYGLSYTDFEFEELKIEKPTFTSSENVELKISIKNTGKTDGAEVIQVYVSDTECSHPRPQKELKGFEKVSLKAGESKQVTISLSKEDFSYWNPEMKSWYLEPGEFEIMVGNASNNIILSQKINIAE